MTIATTPEAGHHGTTVRARPGQLAPLIVAVAILLAVGGWVLVAKRIAIEPGPVGGFAGGVTEASDGVEVTRYLLDGSATGTVRLSLRNAGHAPVTLVGIADEDLVEQPGGPFSLFARMRWGMLPETGGMQDARLGTA